VHTEYNKRKGYGSPKNEAELYLEGILGLFSEKSLSKSEHL
jgi:hypothetical protein